MMLDSLPFRHFADGLRVRSVMAREQASMLQPGSVRAQTILTSRRKSATALAAGLYLVAATYGAALAQQSVPVVRDAEIEALVRDYVRPILQAAGLSKAGITIVLVNDTHFNAFVDG